MDINFHVAYVEVRESLFLLPPLLLSVFFCPANWFTWRVAMLFSSYVDVDVDPGGLCTLVRSLLSWYNVLGEFCYFHFVVSSFSFLQTGKTAQNDCAVPYIYMCVCYLFVAGPTVRLQQ